MVMIRQKIRFGPIWPHLIPLGGAKRGLRVDFYQIWLQIHSKHAPKSAWCEFGKNRTNFSKKNKFQHEKKSKKITYLLSALSLVAFVSSSSMCWSTIKDERPPPALSALLSWSAMVMGPTLPTTGKVVVLSPWHSSTEDQSEHWQSWWKDPSLGTMA